MTVLQLSSKISTGGLEHVIVNLCREFAKAPDWNVKVYAYDDVRNSASLAPVLESLGIPVEILKKNGRFSFKSVLQIRDYIRKNNVHVIHTHDLGALIYGALAKYVSFRRVALVHTQHSFIHVSRHARYKAYERIFTWLADRVCTVSEEIFETYRGMGISADKLKVVHNGVNFSQDIVLNEVDRRKKREELLASLEDAALREALTGVLSRKWAIFLGRLAPRKGQLRMLELWRNLPRELTGDWALLFVGPDSGEEVREHLLREIANAPAPVQALYCGRTAQPTLWTQACDVLVSASEIEGLPLSPIEAVGGGTPALLSAIPAHERFGDLVTCFPLSDTPGALKVLADRLRSFPQSRETTEAHAKHLRERFSAERMRTDYAQIYEECLFS